MGGLIAGAAGGRSSEPPVSPPDMGDMGDLMDILGTIMGGGQSSGGCRRGAASPAGAGGVDLDHLLDMMDDDDGIDNHIAASALPRELAQQPGIDEATAAHCLQELVKILGSERRAPRPVTNRNGMAVSHSRNSCQKVKLMVWLSLLGAIVIWWSRVGCALPPRLQNGPIWALSRCKKARGHGRHGLGEELTANCVDSSNVLREFASFATNSPKGNPCLPSLFC